MLQNLGDKLKSARVNNNLSRNQVAELIGVSVSMIGHYETGERVPSVEILLKLASRYKVSIDYLLGNNTNSNSLSLDGLTYKQIQAVKQIVECFRNLPSD
ncbi:MAG: helix-turn-helix transcriptional regulator [Lachnospiraceae bacterium]|nr:helix-turn-helix transcriptional regulator [Lachnospiraceae bacterium]